MKLEGTSFVVCESLEFVGANEEGARMVVALGWKNPQSGSTHSWQPALNYPWCNH
jgi:hypothetical protein